VLTPFVFSEEILTVTATWLEPTDSEVLPNNFNKYRTVAILVRGVGC